MDPSSTDIEVMVRSASLALDSAMKKEKKGVKKQRSWKQRGSFEQHRHHALPEDEVVLDSEHSWISSSGKTETVIVSIDDTKKGLRRKVSTPASIPSVRSGDPSDVMSMATERVKNGRHSNAAPPYLNEPSTPKRRNSNRRTTYTFAEDAPQPRTTTPTLESPLSNVSNVTSGSEITSSCDSEASSSRKSSSGGRNRVSSAAGGANGSNGGFFKMLKRGMKKGKKKRNNNNKSVEVDWAPGGGNSRELTGAHDILQDLQQKNPGLQKNPSSLTTPPRSNRRVDKRSIQKAPSGGSNTSGDGGVQSTEKKKLKLKVRNKTSSQNKQTVTATTSTTKSATTTTTATSASTMTTSTSAAASAAIIEATSHAFIPIGSLSIQEEKKEDAAAAEDEGTLYELSHNPTGVLDRAIRYRRKAEKLLKDVVPASQIPHRNKANTQLVVAVHVQPQSGMDKRDAQAKARKAYKYAAEARRLYKLLKDHKEQVQYETQFQSGGVNPDESWEQIRDRLLAENNRTATSAGPVIEIGDEFAFQRVLSDESKLSDARSTFSERLELEEHQRKMNELALFSNFSFSPTNEHTGENMSKAAFAQETIAILQQFEDDDISIASPLSFNSGEVSVLSNVTTNSEAELRLLHQKRMEELALFSASLPTSPLQGPPSIDTRAISQSFSQGIALLSDRVQSNYLGITEKGHELVYGGSSGSDSEDGTRDESRLTDGSTTGTSAFLTAGGVSKSLSQDSATGFSYASNGSGTSGNVTGTSNTTGSGGKRYGRNRRKAGPTTLAKRFLMTRQVTPEKDKYALPPDAHDDEGENTGAEDDATAETGLELSYDIHRFGIVRSQSESSEGSETDLDEEDDSEYSDEFTDEEDSENDSGTEIDSCTEIDSGTDASGTDEEEEDDEDYSSQYTDDQVTDGEDSTTLAGEDSEDSTVLDGEDSEDSTTLAGEDSTLFSDQDSVASSQSSGSDDESSAGFSESTNSVSTRGEARRRRVSRRLRRMRQPKTMGEKFTAWVTTLGAN
uniref:Uncharacterized protein n=1 Tax=Grammatophora oceanica TaxID=210454 RepID=A0A7S1UXL8_9STRA|mmetsp:Transcript_286/g.377  ORF Transcript_286/g.377 Transcript_286/m.377 type:complete len:1016 (+) Transcript_286:435-3482(+)